MAMHHDTSSHTGSPELSTLLTAHPASVGETWSQHARFAFSAAGTLAVAAMAAAVHAVLPFLYQTTASRAVDRLHARIHGPRDVETATITSAESLAA